MKYYDGIHFVLAGRTEQSTGMMDRPPSYYGVQLVMEGELSLSIDHRREERSDGPIAFLSSPGHHYKYFSPCGTRDHYYVCFYGEKVDEYIKGELFRVNWEHPLIRLSNPESLRHKMQTLLELIERKNRHDEAVLMLERVLFELRSDMRIQHVKKSRFEDPLNLFYDRVENHPQKNYDLNAEAEKLFVCRNYFNRLFRRYFRMSPQNFILKCRLRAGAKALLESDDPIAQIAHDCGFENEFYFSRQFSRRYGLPPTEYRKESGIWSHKTKISAEAEMP